MADNNQSGPLHKLQTMLSSDVPNLSSNGSPGYDDVTVYEESCIITEEDVVDNPETISIGNTLKICQINVEGLTVEKSNFLSRLMGKANCEVLLIQETHITSQIHLERAGNIDGFTCIECINNRFHGIASYVKNELVPMCSFISKSVSDTVEILVIKLNSIIITNIYKSPSANWSIFPEIFEHPSIYIGDFNSHHSLWGYNTNNENGEKVVEWALTNNLHLLFDAKELSTFHSGRWNTDTNPDLCFVSVDENHLPLAASRIVGKAFPNSQHRPVFLEIGIQINICKSIPVSRWNFKRANWASYSKAVDMNIRWIPPLVDNYDRFVGVVISAAKKYVPRGYRERYIPSWNPECQNLWEQYSLNHDTLIGSELLAALKRAREDRWKSIVANLNFTHSSRKAWDLLRKLGGANAKSNQLCGVNPNKIASRLLDNSKVPIARKTKRMIKSKLKNLKKKIVDSPFGDAVTLNEVNFAIDCLHNGKAAGVDKVFPEFFKNLSKNARIWLSRFFTNCYNSGKIPKIWNKSRIRAVAKPGKPLDMPESYRPISLLCIGYKLLERVIYNRIEEVVDAKIPIEQAGFRKERSCCDQTIAFSTFIEAGFQDKLKTAVVFVDLSTAYDTVWKTGLLYKLSRILKCNKSLKLIDSMLSNRSFELMLGTKVSRRRFLNNGLPQGSVLAPIFFNIYTSDFPQTASRKFIYADDLALAFQYSYKHSAEKSAISTLENDLKLMDEYYLNWRLKPNPNKCESANFHLSNCSANEPIQVKFRNTTIPFNRFPKYLGITFDRSLTYRQHCENLRGKLKTRCNIIQKLSGLDWGACATVLRISTLALVYSAAEYCTPVWSHSIHSKQIDTQLNIAMRIITGTLKSTSLDWLPILSNIAPAELRREAALFKAFNKIRMNPELPIHKDLANRTPYNNRLPSRSPIWSKIDVQQTSGLDFNINERWKEKFDNAAFPNKNLISDPHLKVPGFDLSRRRWKVVNRIRTSCGRTASTLNRWNPDIQPNCDCGCTLQTINHIVNECPTRRFAGGMSEIHEVTDDSLFWIDNLDILL